MYDRTVNGKPISLGVSGMLWSQSLVMIDAETRSLWSHLLGECMWGKMKGTVLSPIPSVMTTWEAWRKNHPRTTVLKMSRTSDSYTKDFYRRPERFVFGWVHEGKAYATSFAELKERPVRNFTIGKSRLLVTYDPQSTGANLFSRTVQGRELHFGPTEKNTLRDRETGTLWNLNTGEAIEGPWRGSVLEQRVGIVSNAKAWNIFHPESRPIPEEQSTATKSR